MPHDLTPADLAGPMDATERAAIVPSELSPDDLWRRNGQYVPIELVEAARQDERRKGLEKAARYHDNTAERLMIAASRARREGGRDFTKLMLAAKQHAEDAQAIRALAEEVTVE